MSEPKLPYVGCLGPLCGIKKMIHFPSLNSIISATVRERGRGTETETETERKREKERERERER